MDKKAVLLLIVLIPPLVVVKRMTQRCSESRTALQRREDPR